MSGHSKWSTIKRQKEASDAKRGARFTKLGRALTVAAKEGGGDPNSNFKLRLAIDQARAANMPKDTIERAIKRGTGELAGEIIEEILYEAFGPSGVALVIESMTNNRNRTVNKVKIALNKYNGSLGGPGSVLWMFNRRGLIRTIPPQKLNNDEAELQLIDFGADDIINDGEELMLLTSPENLSHLQKKLQSNNWSIESSSLEYWPKSPVVFPEGKDGERLVSLVETLENNDDISNVSTNATL